MPSSRVRIHGRNRGKRARVLTVSWRKCGKGRYLDNVRQQSQQSEIDDGRGNKKRDERRRLEMA